MESVSVPKTRKPRVAKSGATIAKLVSDLPLGEYPAFINGLPPVVQAQIKSMLANVKVTP